VFVARADTSASEILWDTTQRHMVLTEFQIPDFCRVVPARRGHESAVGRERDAPNRATVFSERHQSRAADHVLHGLFD